MDLNQLLFQHQIAIMRCARGEPFLHECGSRFDLVRHYETRIARLRHDMGVAEYPRWASAEGPSPVSRV